MKFYKCNHCGNVITSLNSENIQVTCCGEVMNELIAGTTDAAKEKHVPYFAIENNTVYVTVGSVEHPMTEAHFIQFIAVETTAGVHIKKLTHTDEPKAVFKLSKNETFIAVYEYCNLHGLWKA